jgi:hypothetical protein
MGSSSLEKVRIGGCCEHGYTNFNGLLTVHPDTIKVLFAFLNLCAERSPKESDDIRNQMMHTYN